MAADETLNFDWDDLGEVERSEAVLETLETLFERLDAHIDLANRLDKTNPFVVERVMQGCLAVVDMLYTGRQNTCVDAAAYYQNSWEVDSEPVAPPLDMWARGAVVSRERPKLPEDTKIRSGTSVYSESSTLSRAKSVKKPDRSPSTPGEEKPGSRLKNSLSRAGSISPNRRPTKPKPTKDEQEREDRLREEIAIRRREDEIKQELIEADTRAQNELADLKKSLKGKDYSYDHKGDVVVTSKVDPERMPAMMMRPSSTVKDAPAEEQSGSRGSARRSDGGDQKGAKGSGRTAGGTAALRTADLDLNSKSKVFADTVDSPYLELPNEGQPPPAETIKPKAGVTLTAGRTVKKGPSRKADKLSEMTKREFNQYVKQKGHYEKLPHGQGSDFQRQQEEQLAAERALYNQRKAEADGRAAAAAKARQDAEAERLMRRSSMDSVGPLGLGTRSSEMPAWMKDGVPVPKKTAAKPKPRKADINKMLVTSSDWGENTSYKKKAQDDDENSLSPGKPKGKPSVWQRELTVGKVDRRPRDRHYGYITERDLQEYQLGSP